LSAKPALIEFGAENGQLAFWALPMPQRRYILLIGFLWLAATGWVVKREIWPMLRPGEPPAFMIDLIDQTTHGSNAEIEWLGVRNDKILYTIKTSAEYRKQDDLYNMYGYVATKPKGPNQEDQKIHHLVKGQDTTEEELHMETNLFVSLDGEVHSIGARVQYFMEIRKDLHAKTDVELKKTKVVDGSFVPHWIGTVTFYRPDGEAPQEISLVGAEVSLPPRANYLHHPLLPVNRLVDLRPGRHWRVRVVDPLADALASSLPSPFRLAPEHRFLDAEVAEETRQLEWKGKLVNCHVVELRESSEQCVGRIWARASDGLVLRQESDLDKDNDHWDITRKMN
jgi:hypothetical protein